MTEAEFLALSSREKDALVAEKVMGLKAVKTTWGKGKYSSWSIGEPDYDYSADCPEGALANPLKLFSTDIAAAWEVVEELYGSYPGNAFSLKLPYDGVYSAWFLLGDTYQQGLASNMDSAPLAICLAALKAKGVVT
jgi:hypothetical protein